MRVALLGLGSIGRRHARNLLELGCEVAAFDPAGSRAQGVVPAASAEEALDSATAAVVASPTAMHLDHARLALEKGCHVLVEKPLATGPAGVAELDAVARDRNLTLAVAMNLRFHPGVEAMKAALEDGGLGRVLSGMAWCGHYLPSWRPGSDYRRSYSARQELGGGILLDAIHELDYLIWLLGPVTAVQAELARVSDLEIDVEDVAHLHLETETGARLAVVLDCIDRAYHRGCRLVGDRGSIEWRWEDEQVTVYGEDGSPVRRHVASDPAPAYRAELMQFLQVVRNGGRPTVGANDALMALRVVDAARQSATEGRRVRLG